MPRAVLITALLTWGLTPTLEAQGKVRYDSYTLENGLRVFLVEDHSTPIVTVDIWYHVGSRNEQPGRSGFAHLFEHLMFQGSEHVAKGEHVRLVEGSGGELNANTTEDRTAYYQTLPSNRLALGLWLEADRMRSLAVTEQNFTNQRDAVKEERRLRVDNQPYGAAFLDGLTSPFDSATCFPYAHSSIGSMDDLDAAEVSDVQGFFQAHYVPNNATLALVGDFDSPEARRLVQDYFGGVPRGPPTAEVSCPVNYAAGPRTRTWTDPLATLPAVIVAYRIPPHADADTRPLRLLASLLGQGESSRLNRSLVRARKVAAQSAAAVESRGGPGLFYAYAIVSQSSGAETASDALGAEVARLGQDVTQGELDKAKNQLRASGTFERQTTYQMAEEVQHFALLHVSPEEINTDLDRYSAVTLDDLRRVAQKYLVLANSTAIVVNPVAGAGESGGHQHEEDE